MREEVQSLLSQMCCLGVKLSHFSLPVLLCHFLAPDTTYITSNDGARRLKGRPHPAQCDPDSNLLLGVLGAMIVGTAVFFFTNNTDQRKKRSSEPEDVQAASSALSGTSNHSSFSLSSL